MRKFILTFLAATIILVAKSQQGYWQQRVNYIIDVSLDDKQQSLTGFEKIEYTNNSPDTLSFIWFHVWPNAYKNDKTAFSDQLLENGNTDFYFSNKEQKGYINRLDFKVDNITTETEDHPQYIDVIKLKLPAPIAPGQTAIITTPFHVKLPYNFSRGGYSGESFQVTQWYPKPAVYDQQGWHPIPYLDQGEFYSEYGDFDVSITVPSNYAVAATGELQNADEKAWLIARKNFNWQPARQKVKTKGGAIKVKTESYPPSSSSIKILRYKQSNIHDFAWFADKRFIVDHDTCVLPSGKTIDVFAYYTKQEQALWRNSVVYAKQALRTRSEWIGEYPYKTLSVVQGPESFGGGMEYPTITVISPIGNSKVLDVTIAHEISHNWFYGILGSNERDHPWMDEGLNTYYDYRYSKLRYNKGEIELGKAAVRTNELERMLFETKAARHTDQPIETSSEVFSDHNYALVAYYKTGAWMEYLENRFGREAIDKAMQAYYLQWQFKHPQPRDFKQSFERSLGQNLDSAFALQQKTGLLPGQQPSGTRFAFTLSPRSYANYIKNPGKQLISIGPAIGANSYDRIMFGAMITNFKLPPANFEFFLAPMFATGTKKLAGTGLARYTFYPNSVFQYIRLGVSASTFTINQFKAEDAEEINLGFYKVVPSIKLKLREKNPRSTINRFLQFKTFLISEDALTFSRDTVISPANDTTITDKFGSRSVNRTLNQLRFVYENHRVLYPYRGELKMDQGKDFARLTFTGKYFFNYPKSGGLDVRFFAGKFFYLGSRTITKAFATDRYHLNMTGPNGNEDYTYSDYFVGRNEFEGTASQQIMMRDGGFKVRTDLLADKVGRTDDWLIAANFSTSVPRAINPLSLLPVKIPLKVFLDIGTNADAWKRNANTDRFLYDLGLQIPLFQETVNIYIPVLYNKVYRDYYRSTIPDKRFWRTISFTIDISNFNLRKFSRAFAD